MTISIYHVITSAKIALGPFSVADIAPDSLPKVVIIGVSFCHGVEEEEALLNLGISKLQYIKQIQAFRKAHVAVVSNSADVIQQQITEAAQQVDITLRKHYIEKQQVDI